MNNFRMLSEGAPYYIILGIPLFIKGCFNTLTPYEFGLFTMWSLGSWVYIGAVIMAAMIEGGSKP